jgi:hypothetical protein
MPVKKKPKKCFSDSQNAPKIRKPFGGILWAIKKTLKYTLEFNSNAISTCTTGDLAIVGHI